MRPRRGWLLVLGLAIVACGDDDPPAGAIACDGAGCDCVGGGLCSCTTDCHAHCGDVSCSLDCADGVKCNADSTLAVVVDCGGGTECKGNGGDGSRITCDDSAKCELKGGEESVATCLGDADCKINVGARSTVSCQDTASCDIKCAGDCLVICDDTATCSVNCGPEDEAGVPGTSCGDGSVVCGECPL